MQWLYPANFGNALTYVPKMYSLPNVLNDSTKLAMCGQGYKTKTGNCKD